MNVIFEILKYSIRDFSGSPVAKTSAGDVGLISDGGSNIPHARTKDLEHETEAIL